VVYNIFFILMLIGYAGLSIFSPGLKTKIIGILLWFVNFLIFYKGGK